MPVSFGLCHNQACTMVGCSMLVSRDNTPARDASAPPM